MHIIAVFLIVRVIVRGGSEPFTEIALQNIYCFLVLAWMNVYSFLVLVWMHISRGLLGRVSDIFWGKAPDSFGKYMPELFGWSAHFWNAGTGSIKKFKSSISTCL